MSHPERILLAPDGVRRLAATIDRAVPDVVGGDDLGVLAHWWSIGDLTPTADLGPDGHPPRAADLPDPTRRPVRLFAGATIERTRPLRAGEWAEVRWVAVPGRETETAAGRPLSFAEERLEVRADEEVVVRETRTVVYTVPGPPAERRPAGVLDRSWERVVVPDERMLFRFSALTWNAHRIHYDRRFAVGTDGHPGLVVHGPLMAALLADLWEQEDGRPLHRFAFRARAPIHDGEPLVVVGGPSGELVALDAEDRVVMTATAEPARGAPPWTST